MKIYYFIFKHKVSPRFEVIVPIGNIFIGIRVRVFANGQGDQGSIPGQVISRTQNMVLDASLTLSIIWYGSRVSGAIQGEVLYPPLHLGVVATYLSVNVFLD